MLDKLKVKTISANSEELQSLLSVKFALHGRDPRFGLDCYGLVREVYKYLKVELPERKEGKLTIDIINQEAGSSWEKIDSPEPFCVAVMDGGCTLHLGVVVPNKSLKEVNTGKPFIYYIIHSQPHRNVSLDKLSDIDSKVLGYYRLSNNGDETLPEGEGGDVGRSLGGLLVAVAASFLPGAWALTGFAKAFATVAITALGGLVVNKLFPIKEPEVPTTSGLSGELQESRTYTWGGITNTRNQGNIKPVLFGTMQTGGQIITETIWADINSDEYYDVLVNPVKGLISHVTDIFVNGVSIDYYPNTYSAARYGQDEQKGISYFDTLFQSNNLSSLIPQARDSLEKEKNSLVVNVKEALADRYYFELAAPNGCFYLDGNSQQQPKNVIIGCEYYNGSTWVVPEIVSTSQFSAAVERSSGIFYTGWPYLLYDPVPSGNAFAMNFAEVIKKDQTFELYNNSTTYYCIEDSKSLPTVTWSVSLLVNFSTIVRTSTGHNFIKINLGSHTTGSTEPNWEDYLEPGTSFTDGSVIWAEINSVLVFKAYTDSARSTPFSPSVFTGSSYKIQSGDINVVSADVYGAPPGSTNTRYFKTTIGSATVSPYKIRFTVRLCGAISSAEDYYYGYVKIWAQTSAPPNLWHFIDYVTVGSEDVTSDFFGSETGYFEVNVGEFWHDTYIAIDYDFSGSGSSTVTVDSIQIKDIEVLKVDTNVTDVTVSGDSNNPTKEINKTFYVDNYGTFTAEKWRFFRTTPGVATQYAQDQVYLKYYGEGFGYEFDFTYPNHSLIGIRLKATDRLSGSQPNINSIISGVPLCLPASGSRTDTTINTVTTVTSNTGTLVRGTLVDGLTKIRVNVSISDPDDSPNNQKRGFIVLTDSSYPGYAGTDRLLTKPFYRVASWQDMTTYTYLYVEADSSFFVPGETVTFFTEDNSPNDRLAWAVAKMLIQGSRGKITENNIHWDSFKEWDDWNEELVYWNGNLTSDNLLTTPERRHTFNAVIDYQADLLKVAQDACTIGRATVFPVNGKYKIMIDKEATAEIVYGEGEVSNLDIEYLPKQLRANVITSSFLDRDNSYEQTPISTEDPDLTLPINKDIGVQIGVTSTSQIKRQMSAMLLQNKYVDTLLTFDLPSQALGTEVGDVFWFQSTILNDPLGGRITFDSDGVTEDSNTKLLIHGSGIPGHVGIQDDCAHVLTAGAPSTPSMYTNFHPNLGDGSIALQNACYSSIPMSSDFAVGTNSFCFDFWIKMPTYSTGYFYPFYQYDDANNHVWIAVTSSRLYFYMISGGVVKADYYWNLSALNISDAFNHIALSWDSTTLRCFQNGIDRAAFINVGTAYAGTWNSFTSDPQILKQNGVLTAYVDELRFVNGNAKYTTDFTAPTELYKVNSVILDREITPEDGVEYSLKVWDTDNTLRTLDTKIGNITSTLPAPSGFSTEGLYECSYILAKPLDTKTKYRCLEIRRQANSFLSKVNAIEYRDECYTYDNIAP